MSSMRAWMHGWGMLSLARNPPCNNTYEDDDDGGGSARSRIETRAHGWWRNAPSLASVALHDPPFCMTWNTTRTPCMNAYAMHEDACPALLPRLTCLHAAFNTRPPPHFCNKKRKLLDHKDTHFHRIDARAHAVRCDAKSDSHARACMLAVSNAGRKGMRCCRVHPGSTILGCFAVAWLFFHPLPSCSPHHQCASSHARGRACIRLSLRAHVLPTRRVGGGGCRRSIHPFIS